MAVGVIEWQGFSAYTLENEQLRVVMLPQIGGKIVSIYDKRTGYEWLVRAKRPLRIPVSPFVFADYDVSGWDEMFPTISPCEYVFEHGAQVILPDHGELWSRSWEAHTIGDTAVTLTVQGQAFAYTFERTARLVDQGTLLLEYHLTNRSKHPFPFIWAAHPLFRAFPDSRLHFEPVVNEVIVASQQMGDFAQPGERISFPAVQHPSGKMVYLNRVGQDTYMQSRKFYLPPDCQLTSVMLEHPSFSTAMRLSWDGEMIGYFGLWIDERTHSIDYVMAPEPCTGFYDDLNRASANSSVAIIQPGTEMLWSLRFDSLSKGPTP